MSFLFAALIALTTAILVAVLPKYFKKSLPAVWSGYTAPGWEKVRQVYKEQVESGDDLGSGFAVYHQGKLVVNLVGGYADSAALRPWTTDTISNAFSVTKGVSAIVAALLVERGHLDYKEKVSKYWPEFAQNGKEDLTVETLFNHQAGLVVLDEDYYSAEIRSNPEKLSRILAQQKPQWPPGTKHGYHMITFGLYVNEVVKRADPKGRSLSVIFDEDIAQEYDIDFVIGLDYKDFYRTTRITPPSLFKNWESFSAAHIWRMLLHFALNSETRKLFLGSFANPKDHKPGGLLTPEYANAPIGSSNGFGTVESIAKLYGILTAGDNYKGKRLLSEKTVKMLAETLISGPDAVLFTNMTYTRGMSPVPTCAGTTMFGTPGYGGQIGYGELTHNLGFAYLTNNLCQFSLGDNPRFIRLQKAMYECVLEIEKKSKGISFDRKTN